MSPNLSVLTLFPKKGYFLLVGANLPSRQIPSILLLIQPLNFIFHKILPVLNIMMTPDFLFLPKAAHLFIYLLLNPLSSKLLTPLSADKKNSSTQYRSQDFEKGGGGAGTSENLRRTKIRIRNCFTQMQSNFLPKIR